MAGGGAVTRENGSIVLEGALALCLALLSLGLCLELTRRAEYEVLFHHAAFLGVRNLTLGEGKRKTEQQLQSFFAASLDESSARRVLHHLRFDQHEQLEPCEVKLQFRYPAFYRFRMPGYWKHHFELTKSCSFSCSP
jgi:hypothetical protein